MAAVMFAAPSLAQDAKIVDALVDPQSLNQSCVDLMEPYWATDNSIELSADANAGVKNESTSRMLVLAKNKAGGYWSVADLEPGESREFSVSQYTNFALAVFGDLHDCVGSFSVTDGEIFVYK